MNRLFCVAAFALALAGGAFVSSVSFSLPAQAASNADDGLYDPVAPEGSAFVRFIGHGGAEKPSINGKSYESVEALKATAYYVAHEGQIEAVLGAAKVKSPVKAGKFYSAVVSDKALVLLEDPVLTNKAKAQIVFYNLSDAAKLSLKTADDKKIGIVEGVGQNKNDVREINPVSVNLAVYDGDKKIADLGSVALERGQSYGVIAAGKAGAVKAAVVQAKTDTTK
jgi:alginate O-acetyltransferase complex protein AlgF